MKSLEAAFEHVALYASQFEAPCHHDTDILKVVGDYEITVGLVRAIRRWVACDTSFARPRPKAGNQRAGACPLSKPVDLSTTGRRVGLPISYSESVIPLLTPRRTEAA